jgi:hypothetical protein
VPHFLKRLLPSSVVQKSIAKISDIPKSEKYASVFALLRASRSLPKTVAPEILPSDELLEEEHAHWYRPGDFYPVNPGDIFNDKYQVITKLGWGMASTIWLARDLHRYVRKLFSSLYL